MSSRQVEAGGLSVNLTEEGDGDPVLLLHGWPQDHRMWRRVMGELAGRYRLLAPDLRGFGETDAPGHGYDGETFARDQVALLDALGIERAKVIGHDWGGWTAMLLAIRHPERVERMIVIDSPHPWPRQSLSNLTEVWRSWYATVLASPALGPLLLRRTDLVKGVLTRGTKPGTFRPDDLDAYADLFRPPERARAVNSLYRYYLRAFAEGLRGRWRDSRLTVPTLLLFGADDLLVTSKVVDGFEPYADEMRAEIVPDAGHFLVDERPELICERAVEFLG